jgi:hypothetical protein
MGRRNRPKTAFQAAGRMSEGREPPSTAKHAKYAKEGGQRAKNRKPLFTTKTGRTRSLQDGRQPMRDFGFIALGQWHVRIVFHHEDPLVRLDKAEAGRTSSKHACQTFRWLLF